jgi:hypothetical protein
MKIEVKERHMPHPASEYHVAVMVASKFRKLDEKPPIRRKYGEEQDHDEAKDNKLSFVEGEQVNED